MENAGSEGGVGAGAQDVDEMLWRFCTARGDHRNAQFTAECASDRLLETGAGAVAIDAGQQQFAGTATDHFARPFLRIAAAVLTAAVAHHLLCLRPGTEVDGDDDALRAEVTAGFIDQRRLPQCCRIDRDLVSAGFQQGSDIGNAAHTTADRERNGQRFRNPAHDAACCITAFRTGADVEQHQFIGAFLFIALGQCNRIAEILQVHKLHAFDDPAIVHVEAGNDTFQDSHCCINLAP